MPDVIYNMHVGGHAATASQTYAISTAYLCPAKGQWQTLTFHKALKALSLSTLLYFFV